MSNTIVIHGLGYVGLTAAVHYAKVGWTVVGYDPDPVTVEGVNMGKPRAGEFLSYIDSDVAALVSQGLIMATSNWEVARRFLVHSIAVPTERNGEPYDTIVLAVLRRLADDVPDGSTILVESTLTPGTIDVAFMMSDSPLARRVYEHKIALAVCPRRDWFADKDKNLATLTRIVGGVTPDCTDKAIEVLKTVTQMRLLMPTTYKTAEVTKALENALLHVPVMFAHQLAVALPHLNVAEALRLAGTHWRLSPLYLGFGSGGRCVPLGTEYLVRAARSVSLDHPLTIGEQALEWDGMMRRTIVDVVLKSGAQDVLVLGAAYRPDFRDMGLSPGLSVAKHLARKRRVAIHDPMWTSDELVPLVKPVLVANGEGGNFPLVTGYDVILLATPHKAYKDPFVFEWREGQIVLDGQGAWRSRRHEFFARGVTYKAVGEPGWMNLVEGKL